MAREHVTATEAARITGLSVRTITAWLAQGNDGTGTVVSSRIAMRAPGWNVTRRYLCIRS